MTYQELYVQHLERRLDDGGKPEDVESTVREFNNPTKAGFDAWIQGDPWASCSTCGDPFKTESVEPYMEILCPNHKTPRP